MEFFTEICQKVHAFFVPLQNRKGQGLVEYALILVLIAIVVIAAVTAIGTNANTTFNKVATELSK